MPASIAGVAHIDIVAGPDADPCPSGSVVALVELRRRLQEPFRYHVVREYNTSELSRVQPFRRPLFAPPEFRKPLRWIAPGDLLALHPGHEVFPDIVHCLHVVAALLHHCVAPVPAEPDKRNSALNPKSRGLENLATFFHRHAGADGIIYEDDRLVWVDLPFDQLQRTVLLAFLADQQAAVPAAGLQDAGLN